MNWKSVGEAVATVAPILGTALGGPVGLVAGAAGSLVASFLGVEDTPLAVSKAIQDPSILLRLKELESAERIRLIDWQSEQLRAELENVQGARSREVELAKAGSKASWGTSIISTIVTTGFFGMTGLVLAQEFTGVERYSEVAVMLLGVLSTSFGSVVNYYLGSSLGSARKDMQNRPPVIQ